MLVNGHPLRVTVSGNVQRSTDGTVSMTAGNSWGQLSLQSWGTFGKCAGPGEESKPRQILYWYRSSRTQDRMLPCFTRRRMEVAPWQEGRLKGTGL